MSQEQPGCLGEKHNLKGFGGDGTPDGDVPGGHGRPPRGEKKR